MKAIIETCKVAVEKFEAVDKLSFELEEKHQDVNKLKLKIIKELYNTLDNHKFKLKSYDDFFKS